MDIKQCAAYLLISTDTMYEYATTKKIVGFKLGNRWRFVKKMVDAWIQAQCEKQYPEDHV
jgi:excisionase family DNA binding protein